MRLNKLTLTFLCLLPTFAYADLTIVNYSDRPSTSYMNLGACSTMLKKYGTTYPNGIPVTVPHGKLLLACSYPRDNLCNAIVFMNDNCTGATSDYNHIGEGDSVAFVQLNTSNDTITYADDHYSHYKIYGKGGIGHSPVNGQYAMICDLNKAYPAGHECVG